MSNRRFSFSAALNAAVYRDIGYSTRMEAGVQTPDETLTRQIGSCRDSAWLLVNALRHCGLAARFVSGYLVQLAADQPSLDGPSGPTEDFTDLHAWAEVYIPGAGWIGLDPTSALFAGEGHIPLAATPHPASAAAITGATEPSETRMEFANHVRRMQRGAAHDVAVYAPLRSIAFSSSARPLISDCRQRGSSSPWAASRRSSLPTT